MTLETNLNVASSDFTESHHVCHLTDTHPNTSTHSGSEGCDITSFWQMTNLRLVVLKVTQFYSCRAESQVQILSKNSLPFTVNQAFASWGNKNCSGPKDWPTYFEFLEPFPTCWKQGGVPYRAPNNSQDTCRVPKNSTIFWHYLETASDSTG